MFAFLRKPKTKTKKRFNNNVQVIKKKKTLRVDSGKLGWSKSVRAKNFNELLRKSHKKNINIIIIDNSPDLDEVYNVSHEVNKRKLNHSKKK